MATLILSSSDWSNGTIRITYTALNGTLTITEIEGKRGDGYRSYNEYDTEITVSVGGTSKSITLSHHVDFGASDWVTWEATDTSWTGLSGTSISISTTMQSGTPAYSGHTFSGNATMSWDTYTVSYNANGGSGAPSSQTKTYGTALTLSSTAPTRTGYTFLGWGTSASDTTVDYVAGGSYTSNAAITLYAIWKENTLTVNYYSNYADYGTYQGEALSVSSSSNVLVHSETFLYDNLCDLSNVQNTSYLYLSRTGYTSTGYWGTTTNGGTLINQDTEYTGQSLAQALGTTIANGNVSINVYAQWEINTYTIAYNPNGGSGSMDSQSVQWNETFTLSDNTFKREGYKFIGWHLYRNGDDKWYVAYQGWLSEDDIIADGYTKSIYVNQRELTFDKSWIEGNEAANLFTLYAIWEISGVIYIDNGTELVPYLAYIDNGTDWDLYLAYVDNGTDWIIIS